MKGQRTSDKAKVGTEKKTEQIADPVRMETAHEAHARNGSDDRMFRRQKIKMPWKNEQNREKKNAIDSGSCGRE